MLQKFALPFLLLSATPALAMQETHTVSIDGEAIEYSTEVTRGGYLRIRGRELSTGRRFRFRVTPVGQVTGVVATTPVAFRVSRSLRDAAARRAPVAARKRPALGADAPSPIGAEAGE